MVRDTGLGFPRCNPISRICINVCLDFGVDEALISDISGDVHAICLELFGTTDKAAKTIRSLH